MAKRNILLNQNVDNAILLSTLTHPTTAQPPNVLKDD